MRTKEEMTQFCVDNKTASGLTKGRIKKHFGVVEDNLENGELGIFEVNGGVTFKKFKINGDVRLVSLNDNYDDIVVDENVEFKILGKVIS